ncbi:hypothetical protein AVEN_190716-1 [Araneus ventricosus]|uniref:ATP-dependent DNA helicase n=1 Tax=Araneus ventricosus TaxID=182803 RepID=A0A4Y2S052_ARAVE|nr:hypothetical protein AVEN_190716-1 [Araneus ventricosus]
MQRAQYTTDLQWDRVSNHEPSGPKVYNFPLGHHDKFHFVHESRWCGGTVRHERRKRRSVASTGIAATFLSGGRTAHSIFKIPLTLNATSTCNLKPSTSEAKILLDAKVIVWDEAPMTHVHAFLAVDRLLKDLTKCDEPFGGKIILLGGDFRQVLPVILRDSRFLTVSSSIEKHRLWSDFSVMKLTENMRAFDSVKEFASWLLHVGEGESGEKIQLPPFCYPEIQDPVQQLFSDIDFKTVTPEELKGRAILTVTNDLSMQINNRVLECMPGNDVIYKSIDNIVSNDPQDQLAYTEEFLNSLSPTGMPPHKLRLKPGAIIMLLRNLAPSKGPVHDGSSVESGVEPGYLPTQTLHFSTSPPWQVSLMSHSSVVLQYTFGGLVADYSSDCLEVIGIMFYNFLEYRVVVCL